MSLSSTTPARFATLRTSDLSPGEAIALWSVRVAASARGRACPDMVLTARRLFGLAGVEVWMAAVDKVGAALQHTPTRVSSPSATALTASEISLLALLGALQRRQTQRVHAITRSPARILPGNASFIAACEAIADLLTRRHLQLPGRAPVCLARGQAGSQSARTARSLRRIRQD